MSLIILRALILAISIDFTKIDNYSIIILILFPIIVTWFITNLAETNRTPFDFAEGESELVSGFNVEYRSGLFAIIFMAEYINILVIRLFTCILFIRIPTTIISDLILTIKIILLAITFVWIRATFPRIRYDKLINLTWKSFLPLSLICLIIVLPLTVIFQWYCAGWTDNSDDVN